MEIKNKNILVTGGTGFVGSHLVEELLKNNNSVVTTYQTQNPFSYFYSKKLQEKTIMVQADVCDFDKVYDIVTKYNIDYVFHLAAQALVEPAYYNPKQTLYTNILGTVNVLEAARLFPKVGAVVVASSDKAYGKLGKVKYREQDALRGDHPYEVSKSSADLITSSYYKTYGVPAVITRFGNIYGEGDLNFSRIIPGAFESLITNKQLEIRSDGKFVRDYIYVKDVVRGYLSLAKNIETVKGEAFNFGSNATLSVFQVLNEIKKYLKQSVNYKVLNNAKNEIKYQSLDYSKIKKTVGWEPQFTLESSLSSMAPWYLEYFKKKIS